MRKYVIAALALIGVAIYPCKVISYERKRLNKLGVLLRAYSPPAPGLQLNPDREELKKLVNEARVIRLRSWSKSNRRQARDLIGVYNTKFPLMKQPRNITATAAA